MKQATRRILTLLLALPAAASSHAQFYKNFYKLHGGTISASATGEFTTPLTSNPTAGLYSVPSTTGGVLQETVSNQQQYTTDAAGLLASLQFHPKAWAGVEVNYGFTQYTEQYAFNYSGASAAQQINVPTAMHEFTAAYQFHPHHIPFQPFVNVGGGAIDFYPSAQSNQWRGAGLLEAGFDIPTHIQHLAIRAQGRALFYRAPNFNNPAISTRSWRSTEEPALGIVYRF